MSVPNATVQAARALERCRPPVLLPPEGKYCIEGKPAHPVTIIPGLADAPILILGQGTHVETRLHHPPENRPYRVLLARLATNEEKEVWQRTYGAPPRATSLMTLQTLAPAGQLGRFVLDGRTPPVSYLPTI